MVQPQYNIEHIYQSGVGVKRDYAQALAWYQRGASHGNSNAENQLGYMAEEGWGQPQNYAEALSWYNKAAEHGNAQAQENIGYMYQHGSGVSVDYAKAMAWFEKAAAQGNGDAANQIGWMYQYGQGVKADDARALSWYQLAAQRGSSHGERNVDDFTSDLDERGALQAAAAPVHDAAFLQAERWGNIQYLRGRIDGVESDALYQEDLASQLEHMGKGKNDGVSKIFKAMGSVGAVKYHVLADQDRAEAARLRDQLAQIEDQSQSSLAIRAP
jgi:Sel1 repeat